MAYNWLTAPGAGGYDNYDSPDLRNFTLNEWHHIAVVVKRISYIRFYFDGVLRGQILPAHLGSLANSSTLRIGANGSDNPSATGFFKGALDELDLFNRALTTAEVQAIYSATQGGKCK